MPAWIGLREPPYYLKSYGRVEYPEYSGFHGCTGRAPLIWGALVAQFASDAAAAESARGRPALAVLPRLFAAGADLCLVSLSLLLLALPCVALLSPELLLWRAYNFTVFMALPLLLGALLVRTLFRAREARINAALSVVVTVISLFAAEAILIALGPGFFLPAGFDKRSKIEVVMDLRSEGIAAYPSFAPEKMFDKPLFLDEEPLVALAGLSDASTVLCNEIGEYYVYQSDRYGFTNPSSAWSASPAAVLIGDSFTQGWCMPGGLSYAERLRARNPALLNLGINGDGPLSELATLREYAADLRPQRLVWIYFEGNDIEDLSKELASPVLSKYLADGSFRQGLAARSAEVDGAIKSHLDALIQAQASDEWGAVLGRWRSELPDKLRLWMRLWHVRGLLGLTDLKRDWPMPQYRRDRSEGEVELALGSILSEAKAEVESWGGRLYFVYLPAHRTFAYGIEHPWRARVLRMAKERGIQTLDLLPAFAALEDPLSMYPFRKNGHYTREGNQFVADEIAKFIELPQAPAAAER